jgi:murein DD-endopeptidase MepM/ murein hydrolase activator NlpD
MKLRLLIALLLSAVLVHADPRILLSSKSVPPGETLRIIADGVEPQEKMRVAFAKGFYPLFAVGPDAQRGLIGMRIDAEPGPYELKLQQYSKKTGRWETFSVDTVEIATRTYTIEHVNFKPSTKALQKYEHQESQKIRKLLLAQNPEQYWEGLFDYPIKGPIIGEFGVRRVRNGVTSGYHKGYDLKGAAGTPILAPAAGVVMLTAPNFKAHGKTVLVNHGQGVMTIYLHMSAIAVTQGQKVVRGQKLGLVGSTGLSTAPHLHWGFYVHGVAVDGKTWTETEF